MGLTGQGILHQPRHFLWRRLRVLSLKPYEKCLLLEFHVPVEG